MKQSNGSSIPVKVLRYLLMAFVLVISLYPILWVLLNSFKQTPGGLGLPEKWVFDGYITIFTKLNIGQYFLNSLIVTVISTVISVFAVSLAAYVSARISFKGRSLVTLMFASTLFIPSISISFPIYRLLSDLGLKDTLTGVIFVYASLGIAVTFFILRSYFLSIPKEMEAVSYTHLNSASRLTNGPMTLLMRSTRISRLISSVTNTELTLSQISCPRRDGVRIQFLRIKISLPFPCFFAVLPVMIA